MTDQEDTAPAVWDPTARGGAGGWVRRGPVQQPPAAGEVGDQGPPLAARPYLTAATPPPRAKPPAGQPPAGYGFPPPPAPPQFQPQSPYPPAFPPPPPPPPQQPGALEYPPAPYEPPGYEEPRRSRTPLYVAIGVALTVLLGGGVVWAVQNTGGSSANSQDGAQAQQPQQSQPAPAGSLPQPATPSGSATASQSATTAGPDAAAQAKALDELLSRGESAKAPIGNAVAKVTSCPGKAEVESAVQVFDTGASQRDQLIADLGKLNLNDLPGGADAAQALRTAWQQSGDIDRAYAAWARTVGSQGCTGSTAPSTADLKRANELNPQATQSKKDFVTKWNALASTFSLTARTWDRI